MNRMVMISRVGLDGFLHLDLPLGVGAANQEVQITVEPVHRNAMTQEEWEAWVRSLAGTWQGEFERMPQEEYEDREPL